MPSLFVLCLFYREYGVPVAAVGADIIPAAVFRAAALAGVFGNLSRSQRRTGGSGRSPQSTRGWDAPAPRLAAWAVLLLRAILGTAGIFAHFYALGRITIAEGLTLNKTAPFFTVLFAWAFLGERANRSQWLSLAIAFAGVVLIAKPGFAGISAFPLAIGLLSGVCAGGAYACVRALRRHELSPSLIILFFSAFSCLASVPFMLAGFDPMTMRQVLVLLGAGIGAAIGQFGITLAYGYAAPREIAVFDYSGILFAGAFGFLFFAQLPDLASMAGFAAILIAAFLHSR